MNSELIKKRAVRQVEVSEDREGQRLDNFLSANLKGVPKSAIYRLIRTGQVRINGKRCKPERKLTAGDTVRIPPVRSHDEGPVDVSPEVLKQVEAAIVYQDPNYFVIDKPSGMAVHSGSHLPWGLIDVVRQMRPGEYVELAHRIDRETSGCVVLARTGKALGHLSAQFRAGTVSKKYLCLLGGRLKEARVLVDAPLLKVRLGEEHAMEAGGEGKQARTEFRLLRSLGESTYAEATLFTGRTHQIRAHAAHLGLPLAGDDRYGTEEAVKRWRSLGLRRLFLHAHHVSFQSVSGDIVSCDLPLPHDLRSVLDRLGG